jgi:bifunctional non-homologous end joining protein LigD
MLSRPGLLPSTGYAYEPKWDGFRAVLSTEDGLRVRSRRGWSMTSLLPELAGLPGGLMLDGELIAVECGRPSFPLLCRRMLHNDGTVSVTFVVFDVLSIEGIATMLLPYAERRRRLEELDLEGPSWCVSPTFDDGDALWATVVAPGLEGLVAKKLSGLYRPGERGDWVKVKNRAYWRYPLELAAVQARRR